MLRNCQGEGQAKSKGINTNGEIMLAVTRCMFDVTPPGLCAVGVAVSTKISAFQAFFPS